MPSHHWSGGYYQNLPPKPNPYISGPAWDTALKINGGDPVKAKVSVLAAQAQLAKELGIKNDPYFVWADSHDSGQFIVSRVGVPGNTPTIWSHVNYGQKRDGSYMTKEESLARQMADKKARETMTALEYEAWKLAGN